MFKLTIIFEQTNGYQWEVLKYFVTFQDCPY